MESLLFVYGTLRRAATNPLREKMAREVEFVSEAIFQGRLYRVRHYPGVVPSNDSGDSVVGEVFRLRDAEALLARLDDYEGCGLAAPDPPEYVRRLLPVRLADGRVTHAWVYVYNWPVDETQRIASGDFLDPR